MTRHLNLYAGRYNRPTDFPFHVFRNFLVFLLKNIDSTFGMDSRIGHEFRNAVHNFFNNHNVGSLKIYSNNFQVNFCITAAIGIAATYASFATILGQNLGLFDIFSDVKHVSVHPLLIHADDAPNDVNDFSETVMSLLILWIIAAVVGKLFNLLDLPFVFGMKLALQTYLQFRSNACWSTYRQH